MAWGRAGGGLEQGAGPQGTRPDAHSACGQARCQRPPERARACACVLGRQYSTCTGTSCTVRKPHPTGQRPPRLLPSPATLRPTWTSPQRCFAAKHRSEWESQKQSPGWSLEAPAELDGCSGVQPETRGGETHGAPRAGRLEDGDPGRRGTRHPHTAPRAQAHPPGGGQRQGRSTVVRHTSPRTLLVQPAGPKQRGKGRPAAYLAVAEEQECPRAHELPRLRVLAL